MALIIADWEITRSSGNIRYVGAIHDELDIINTSVTSYADAWTARATLTYNIFSVAF